MQKWESPPIFQVQNKNEREKSRELFSSCPCFGSCAAPPQVISTYILGGAHCGEGNNNSKAQKEIAAQPDKVSDYSYSYNLIRANRLPVAPFLYS